MKFDNITSLRVFKSIYETKSLTRSSEKLGLSKAALSKRLEGLELDLGVKLFARSTRSLAATLEADRLINRVNEIIERVDGLQQEVKLEKTSHQKVRVTCISSMAQRFIGDLLFRFQLEHPNFLIELVVTDSVLDVVEHNIDLAIRVNPSKNSILVGGKVGVQQLLVVATPGYLKKHKRPKTLGDLCHHPLLYIDQHAQALSFLPKELQKKLEERRVFRTNDSPLLTKLLLNGESIGLRSSWDVKEGLKKKDLVLALPADSLKPTGDLWVLASAERLKSEAVREVYDFLVKKMKLFLA